MENNKTTAGGNSKQKENWDQLVLTEIMLHG